MKQQTKELRIRIDGLKQLTESLKPIDYLEIECSKKFNSIEIGNAIDSLLLAKAWLGKLLSELGEESPYSSGKKTVEDIEPTAHITNSYNEYIGFKEELSHIEKVDWLKSFIQEVIDEVYKLLEINSKLMLSGEYVWKHLCEARFHLGFELARVKEESHEK